MKVILLKDVPNVGRKEQIVEVSDGYGQNFLIPRKLAVLATSGALNNLKNEHDKRVQALKDKVKDLVELKKQIDNSEFVVETNADGFGNVAGKVSQTAIQEAIEKTLKVKIDKKTIEKKEISAFGKTTVKIELFQGVVANAKIEVRRK